MQNLIYKIFTRKFSLSLQADSLLYLSNVITERNLEKDAAVKWLEKVADAWTKHEERKPLVELEPLKSLVSALSSSTKGNGSESGNGYADSIPRSDPGVFSVISGFDIPAWWYDGNQKKFIKQFEGNEILSSAETKSALFRQRYDLLKQRIMRNENFMPVLFSDEEKDRFYQISTVDSLQGREGEQFLLFGMLSQIEEGKIYLEDKSGSIELDFSKLSKKNAHPNGIFTENCFVLVDGCLDDKIFVVDEIGLPPPEPKEKTKAAFPNINMFGNQPSFQSDSYLRNIETTTDSGIVILSDVWLDDQGTMDALQILFEGFSNATPPIAFIFIGDFSSQPFVPGSTQTARYRENMTALGQLIGAFPEISRNSHFVFIPGNNDPWGQGALPKPPIAEFFTKRLANRIANVTFSTNPCRIKYCTQEIIIFREDLLKRMRRNSIVPHTEGSEIVKHLIRTVIDQSHLFPLPLRIRPIYWAYDHAMRLYPIPDMLVLADRFDSYSVNYEGCHCINPGSFSSGGYSFFMYYPASKTSQFSQIPKK